MVDDIQESPAPHWSAVNFNGPKPESEALSAIDSYVRFQNPPTEKDIAEAARQGFKVK